MHFSKQNSMDILKKLSVSISKNEVDYKDSVKGSIQLDVINKAKEDAKQLRYDMQINNQEVYKVYTYVSIFSKDKEKLFSISERFKAEIITKMLNINTLNFRHLLGYKSIIPFNDSSSKLMPNYYVNMTTENIKMLFPFYTKAILESGGILFGKIKNSSEICILDMFSNLHLNSNMCIFGSSGSGKSYFTKLMILRNYLKSIKQYVIDQEAEYLSMPGTIFDVTKDKINILQIFKYELKNNYLKEKINKVSELIVNLCDLKEEINVIKEAIKEEYMILRITDDITSIYEIDDTFLSKKIKDKSKFPTISDVINNISANTSLKKKERDAIVKKLKNKFEASFSFLNGITNLGLDSDIVVFNISQVNANEKSGVCEIILEYIKNNLSINDKSLIYIDEVWKLIYTSEALSEKIFDLYKTVRKRNAGIVTITQDISDFFSKDGAGFGKSIFNNSYIKLFFKVEYQETEILRNIGIINEEDYRQMSTLNKGEMNMYLNNSCLGLKIEANEYEKKYIEGGKEDDNTCNK